MSQGKVLLLYRYRPPHQYRWNGVGGKIEQGETPREAIAREVREEAAMDLAMAEGVRFAGIVTWSGLVGSPNNNKGMYAFIADFSKAEARWEEREIDEGRLGWKEISWSLDASNPAVAENIPHFLPRMIEGRELLEYHCVYEGGEFKEVIIRPLPDFVSAKGMLSASSKIL